MTQLHVVLFTVLVTIVPTDCCDQFTSDLLQQLTKDIQGLKNADAGQNDRLRQLEQENDKLRRINVELGEKLTTVLGNENELRSLIGNTRSRRILLHNVEGYGTTTAFTAKLSQHVIGLGNHQAVIFDNVVSNLGNAYSPVTGVFTSPINGTYFFFASILSHSGEFLETEIVKNGNRVVMMFTYGNARNDQGVNAAVISLMAGDKVWVRNVNTAAGKVYGGNWCSFSGFQII